MKSTLKSNGEQRAEKWAGVGAFVFGTFAGFAIFVGCTVDRASVGQNPTFCDTDDDCPPDEQPYCDNDISVCQQCYMDSDCGGAEPNCKENACECTTDDDCKGRLRCADPDPDDDEPGTCAWPVAE